MSRADKMFEKMGFFKTKTKESYEVVCYSDGYEIVEISWHKDYRVISEGDGYDDYPHSISIELHLAIHEKMKELGWLV